MPFIFWAFVIVMICCSSISSKRCLSIFQKSAPLKTHHSHSILFYKSFSTLHKSVIHLPKFKYKDNSLSLVTGSMDRSKAHINAAGDLKDDSSTSFEAALEALSSIVAPVRHAVKPDGFKQKMQECLKVLQMEKSLKQLKVIHVAGTKGKGSTCAFAESILRQHGFHTGLFTSPHLISVCERFRLNGAEINERKFLKYFWSCWNCLKENNVTGVHFFQFLTLLSFKIFIEEKVDVAILEVGLGGKFDATNVVDPVVCGITSLGYDHTEILGNSLKQIAGEKAGIMKLEVPTFTVPQPLEAMEVLKDKASQLSIPLHIVLPLDPISLGGLKLGLDGKHQYMNAGLAVNLCESWLRRTRQYENFYDTGISVLQNVHLPEPFIKGLTMVNVEGRGQIFPDQSIIGNKISSMEECQFNSYCPLTFYLDGAHSPESMEACADWFSSTIKNKQLSLNKEKEKTDDRSNSSKGLLLNTSKHRQHSVENPVIQKQILLFNCMSVRDPQLLLSHLLNKSSLNGVHFHKAIFVPSDSPSSQFSSKTMSMTEAMGVDLSWQLNLQRTWEQLIQRDRGIDKNLAPNGSYLVPSFEPFLESFRKEFLEASNGMSSAVIPSAQMAIQCLRESIKQNQRLQLHVLVTGSLHLIGDVLKILKK